MVYSESEIRLIKYFGYGHLICHIDIPSSMYSILMEKAFINNMQGSEVDSLRKIIKALSECGPYRLTPEFEALIEFS